MALFEAVIIGGSSAGSFVLESKDIRKIYFHSRNHTAHIFFHLCKPFKWFIENFGEEMENSDSIWSHMRIISENGRWHIEIDTNYISLCIS